MNDALPAPVVLIVEDEWLVRAEVAQEFQRAGWRVLEASTGEGCLALAHKGHPIDAVVTDIHLAGHLSGWDVAEAFRAIDPNIPIIYASGNSIEKTRMVQGSVFLTKPCRSSELLEICRRLSLSIKKPEPLTLHSQSASPL